MGMIGSSIEILIQYAAISWCRRYAFLEKSLERKKQRIYHLIAIVLLLVCNLLLGENGAQVMLFLVAGLNIALARKTHRVRGFFLVIPVAGIINGLVVPILLTLSGIFGFAGGERIWDYCILYGMIAVLAILFYVKGKNWRDAFETEMGDRHLQKWESILLCIVGVLMMCFSSMISYSVTLVQDQTKYAGEELYVQDIVGQFISNLFLICAVSFVLSITIIILIMQGNKRAYYYEKVGRMSLQMVHTLANTIDAKDSYTNGHSTRVAEYSVMLAEKMGYTGERLERVQFAALLHDIGKIGVPVEIINKPARLTDEEYEIIKTHPVIGANILKEITEIPDISIGARYHHERYDGKGYPDHLKGQDIPEIARIIGVADSYDAMTSTRSYRDLLPQEVVRKEIEKGKGPQFDPEIADIMLKLMDEDEDYKMHE